MSNLNQVLKKVSEFNVRTSKQEAFNALLEIIHTDKIELVELAHIYNYLIPQPKPKRKNIFDVTRWLSLAAAKTNEPRGYLRLIHVKDGVAVCSNGHVLHSCEVTYDDGFYEAATFKPTTCAERYPNIMMSYPSDEMTLIGRYSLDELETRILDNSKVSKVIRAYRIANRLYEYNLVNNIFTNDVEMSISSCGQVLHLTSDDRLRTAFIAPLTL